MWAAPSQLCRLGLRRRRQYLILTGAAAKTAGRRGTLLGQSAGLVNWVCASPRDSCLVPLETWEQCSRGPCRALMECRCELEARTSQCIGFLLRSVGFGNDWPFRKPNRQHPRERNVQDGVRPGGVEDSGCGSIVASPVRPIRRSRSRTRRRGRPVPGPDVRRAAPCTRGRPCGIESRAEGPDQMVST